MSSNAIIPQRPPGQVTDHGVRGPAVDRVPAAQRRVIFMQKDDEKARHWISPVRNPDVVMEGSKNSSIYMPFQVLRSLLRHRKLNAVIFRYLNDYPGLIKSLIRAGSETLTLLICRMTRTKVVWICHNVDRETECHHPWLSNLRRNMVSESAASVFVLDQLLLPHAKRALPHAKSKIDHISFGSFVHSPAWLDKNVRNAIRMFLHRARESSKGHLTPLIGWCIGSPAEKVAHFKYIPRLISEAERCGYAMHFVIIGPVKEFIRKHHPDVLEYLESSHRILLLGERITVGDAEFADQIDFYWRAYSDLSVPMSLYTACTVGKPVLTIDAGFLGEAVQKYSLGGVLKTNFENIAEAIEQVRNWSPEAAQLFLREHNWESASKKLVDACRG